MRLAVLIAALAALAASCTSVSLARAVDSKELFDEAVRYDLSGEGAAPSAFALYLRAAKAGMSEAEFNVAIMLDSGRGVPQDLAQAATWYARAAARGNQRAAYNVGQLYADGQGVPRNADLARAWFTESDLPAARDRLAVPATPASREAQLSAPILLVPGAGSTVMPETGGVELVWTAKTQPEPVQFFVELRAFGSSGWHEVFSGFARVSSVLARLPDADGDYAWRVLVVAPDADRYVASNWSRFKVSPPEVNH